MKKGFLSLAILSLALHQSIAGAQQNGVVATVNGKPIKQQELAEYQTQRGDSAGSVDQKELINELVARELIYQDAVSKKLDKKPEVVKELEQIRVQVLVGAAVRNAIEANPVTDQELQKEYDRLKSQMATQEYKARHILVKTEEEAKSIITQLNKGAKFADLAGKHSLDRSGKNGGDLGWFAAEQMVQPFAAAVKGLKKGTYTKTPVETQFGWHVIELEDTRATQPPSFEQVKERLQMSVQQQRIAKYIEGLRNKAKIEIK